MRRALPGLAALALAGCVGVVGDEGPAPLDQADAGAADVRPDAGAFVNAGAVDAGVVDAGATDAGPPDAGVVDACAGLLLCEDFESYDAGRAPSGRWQTSLAKGTVAVDTAHAASGAKAVRLTVQAGTASDSYRVAALVLSGAPYFPWPANAIYGRLKLFVPTLPPGSDVHYDFVNGQGFSSAASGDAQVKYGAMNQKHFLANLWESPTQLDCWKSSNTSLTMPEGRWACLEWHFDGARNEAELWLDGQPVNEVTVMGQGDGCVNRASLPWHFPAFDRLSVGWMAYQAYGAQELWLDDVALGTQRIGCR